MNNIIYDDLIITPENNMRKYYKNFTNKLNGRDSVKLSLFCAKIVNHNNKKSNLCIKLVEKWLVDENSISREKLWNAAYAAGTTYAVANAVAYAAYSTAINTVWAASYSAAVAVDVAAVNSTDNINIINKYLQILLRKVKQFQNNKILEQISKTAVDKLELVDWNMITDIMQEEYNIVHEFSYSDIFSRRCLIELLRREYA